MRFVVLPLGWVFWVFTLYLLYWLSSSTFCYCLLLSLKITFCTLIYTCLQIFIHEQHNFQQHNSISTLPPMWSLFYISLLHIFLIPNTFFLSSVLIFWRNLSVCVCTRVHKIVLFLYKYLCFGCSVFLPTDLGFSLMSFSFSLSNLFYHFTQHRSYGDKFTLLVFLEMSLFHLGLGRIIFVEYRTLCCRFPLFLHL